MIEITEKQVRQDVREAFEETPGTKRLYRTKNKVFYCGVLIANTKGKVLPLTAAGLYVAVTEAIEKSGKFNIITEGRF